jgi:lipopolysaccharide transport system permease protein
MPIFFIPVLMCIGSLAIAVAFVAPYVRDIGDFIQVCMNVLYWLTPVVYQASILPEWVQRAERFNPFYILMHPIHMVAYEHTLPGIDDIARLFVLTVLCIFVGFSIFRICRRNYVYYL